MKRISYTQPTIEASMKLNGARTRCDEGTPVRILHEHIFLLNKNHGCVRRHDRSSDFGLQRLSVDRGSGR